MKTNFGRCIPSLFLIAIVFTVGNAFLSYVNLGKLTKDIKWFSHANKVVTQLKAISTAVNEAESAERGYILSNDPAYRERYYETSRQVTQHIHALTELTKNDLMQTIKVQQLDALTRRRINYLKEGLHIFDTQGFESAQQYVLKGEGITTMNEIESLSRSLEKHVNDFKGYSEQETSRTTLITYITITLATLLNLTLVIVTYVFIKRELDKRYQAELRKDEFISIASHELKTPITSMQAFAHMLEKKIAPQKDTSVYRYIHSIKDQIIRQTNLINDLLDISKMQAGKIAFHRERFPMLVLITEVVGFFQASTPSHTIIVKGKSKAQVYADRERISQVLINFLSNAVKYSPQAKRVVVTLSESKSSVQVSVRDFGIGIPKKEHRRIFNRFYRTKTIERDFPGLGIGLYISYEIIKKQKGKLTVDSEEGKGSTFSFILPKAVN